MSDPENEIESTSESSSAEAAPEVSASEDASGQELDAASVDTASEDTAAPAAEETDSESVATPPAAPAPPPPAPASTKPAVDPPDVDAPKDWYILKVAFNRETTIADALRKRVNMEGMQEHIEKIVVPTEDVATFTRDGKRRISQRKLLPGYIMVYMRINDDTWFLVRETGGISDFTGASGKPMPMEPEDVERFINRPVEEDDEEEVAIKTNIPFKVGDRVRVKEGNFENQEGDVDAVDESNGRITVIINIFDRSVPMELDHWQVEPL